MVTDHLGKLGKRTSRLSNGFFSAPTTRTTCRRRCTPATRPGRATRPAMSSISSRRPSPTGTCTSARNSRSTSTDCSRGRLARHTPLGLRPAPYRPGSGVSSPRPRPLAGPVKIPPSGRSPRPVDWSDSPPRRPPVRPRRESRGPPQLRSWRRTPARAPVAGPTPPDSIRQRDSRLERPGDLPVGRRQRARVPPGPQEESVRASLLDLSQVRCGPPVCGGWHRWFATKCLSY
jgi:hypothetical protein